VSSSVNLKKEGWSMVAITSGKHLGATLAMLGIHACLVKIIPGTDSPRHGCRPPSDASMYRIYTRTGNREKGKRGKETAL
jgi:hypothetical protein